MPSSQIERKLAAIMFTDIAGSTAQMSKDEAVAISLLNKKESILKPLIAKHNGTYVKSTGDGSLSHFNSAVDAATCAKRFQESIYDDKDLNVRVGVHLGDTIFEKGDIRGDGVNIASRLESMAVEGGVFVSKEVHDQLANQKEFEGVSLGLQTMKGVGRLIEVYGLKGDLLTEPKPSDYQDNKVAAHSDEEVPSIAIIPFRNKGKAEDAFYAYGICADLISDCSSAGLIRVASLERVEELSDLLIEEKAKKLDVRYIVTGNLWKMDDMFQLSIEIYDTKETKIMWSDRWQENWDNLPTIKMNLSDGLLKALDTTFKVERKVETTNTEAYEYYLKGKYKYKKGKTIEDTKIARGLLEKAIELDDNLILAKVQLGKTYSETSDYDKAMEIFTHALNQAKKLGDKYGIGINLICMGRIYSQKGDYNIALDYYTSSLKIAEKIIDKKGVGYSLSCIGDIQMRQGNYDTALNNYSNAHKIFKEIGDKQGLATTLGNMGNYFSRNEATDKALEYYIRSLNIKKEIGNKRGIAVSLSNIGRIYCDKGNYDSALDYFVQGLEIRKDLGDKRSLLLNNNIGMMYKHKGDLNKALKFVNRSLEISQNLEMKYHIGYSLNNIGIIYAAKSDYLKAKTYFIKALSIKNELNSPQSEVLWVTVNLFLTYKYLNKEYDGLAIHNLIKESNEIGYKFPTKGEEFNFCLYQLLENASYLETAYNQVQEKADNLEPDVAAKFLSYPIPKAIVEEWEKVK